MPTIFNLRAWERPLSVISENKDFLRDLKRFGLKENRVREIIFLTWRRSWDVSFDFDLRDSKTKEILENWKRRERKISRTISKCTSCLSDDLISKKAKAILKAEKENLLKRKDQVREKEYDFLKFKPGRITVKFPGPRKAKTENQRLGLIVYELYNYIEPILKRINGAADRIRDYKKKEIFSLIAEILRKTQQKEDITPEEVKTFYFNKIP